MYTYQNVTLESCERLINAYIEHGGEVYEIEPGCLGLGTVVLFADGALKAYVIQEFFISEWCSGHKVQIYPDGKLPVKWINKIGEN